MTIAALDVAACTALVSAVAEDRGVTPGVVPCDVCDPASVAAAVRNASTRSGAVDVLINNVGRDSRHTLASLDSSAWDELMAVNLKHCFFAAQAVAPAMVSRRSGAIVNIGSNAALLGLAGYPAYVSAKAGIIGLTRALARELGPNDVRVNCVVPGWVLTRRQRAETVTDAGLAECLAQQCIKRPVEGTAIGHACLYLASHAAEFVTGQTLVVDGGRVFD